MNFRLRHCKSEIATRNEQNYTLSAAEAACQCMSLLAVSWKNNKAYLPTTI